jgi:ABC-type phosphate/phosphonate transport system permease subunit
MKNYQNKVIQDYFKLLWTHLKNLKKQKEQTPKQYFFTVLKSVFVLGFVGILLSIIVPIFIGLFFLNILIG